MFALQDAFQRTRLGVAAHSALFSSPAPALPVSPSHVRSQSIGSPSTPTPPASTPETASFRHSRQFSKNAVSSTFAPSFIKAEDMKQGPDPVDGIEGENDFSGKRYVWVKDTEMAFVKGWVVEELEGNRILVQCDDGSQRDVDADSVDKVNPAKFDKATDMAELTHLNEASVVHNLYSRYQADLIYTYSGLFLVTVNPYCPLPIYTNEYIDMYKGRNREDTKPHIYAMADEAFRNLVEEGQNQSILVTGESGAGKTENTKKVIQYLAAVAHPDSMIKNRSQQSNLSQQILRTNPILEAFGNAQTVRNHNSSRFGKFIRIEFSRHGAITGAFIDWYLLEKSRVVRINSQERSYHIFYQLLKGASPQMKKDFLLQGLGIEDFQYTRHGHDTIVGVSDREEWDSLMEAFAVMGFDSQEQSSILRTIAAVLHLGNVTVVKESRSADQARLDIGAKEQAAKAGREWVEKVQTPEQVRLGLDALSKGIYERGFGDLVTRINRQLDNNGGRSDDTHFIGVLDIAGFEIFEENSFEQLCINYTNEKLQQFFNHHMFVLEQEEYAREQIEWKFIDFGRDLQPTIDLIELPNPIGIFSCLDEDCVMPKATDKTFTEKLHSLWDKKSPKYRSPRLGQGFVLTHYAADVEYSTEGWLEKNKDPLNDNITRLLSTSSDKHIASLFADCAETDDIGGIRSRMFNNVLVLDQLRCNGVLEGIRIARTGFPNRLLFAEFRQRYEVLCSNMPKGYLEGQVAATLMLEKLGLEKSRYRVGLTKVFFRAGVLAELEEKRDALITQIMARFQSVARGFVTRRSAHKRLFRTEATRIIQRNFHVYLDLADNPWWQLISKMKPLLGATRTATEVKRRDAMIKDLNEKMRLELENRQKLEDERRNCNTELARIQQTLESERALALDKEEIFKRLQEREAELEEKLSGALDDQERLEEQLDSLMDAKNRAERDVETYRSQLDQAASLIAKLEEEKGKLTVQVAELEKTIEELSQKQSERSEHEEALEGEIELLQSQLALKERKSHELESKLLKIDQDAEVKLRAAEKELESLAQLSKTSTDYEDLVRQKESELAFLRKENKRYESERRGLEDQKKALSADRESATNKLHAIQAEIDVMKSKQFQLQREAEDANKLLQARLSEDAQVDKNLQVLECQVKDLKEQLYTTQSELSRERQSRDDVQLLGEHKYESLKEEYDQLNDTKITIEKELYAQQDTLRRTMESRSAVEKERDEARHEIRRLRAAKAEAEEARLRAEEAGERQASNAAREREMSLRKDLDAASERLRWFEEECTKLNHQVEDLNKLILTSGEFGLKNDQAKERMERELGTVKSRLMASENDNRALLNKLQQKGLEIARSSSRASEASRGQIMSLQREKARLEEQSVKLNKQLGDAQVTITSLEKKAEKLQLSIEDLNHELAREAKSSRDAEKTSSTVNAQLTEANRTIESERQMRSQAQSTMLKALRSADPGIEVPPPGETGDKATLKNFDLARKVDELQQNLRVQTAARTNAENQIADLRAAAQQETTNRPKLEEIHFNEAPFHNGSPTHRRATKLAANRTPYSNTSTPTRRMPENDFPDSTRSDKTADILSFNNRQDLKAELEELQNQLQLAQMQNRHLQSQKLEKVNGRLQEMLDDSTKKVSALEKSIRSGELSLRDIQTRSHEELLDVFNSQEQSRRSLLHIHKDTVAELTDIKATFEKLRHDKAQAQVDLRDAKSDLQEMTMAREQESQSRSQLLQEYSDLQIRLDAETSKLADVTANLDMYKRRADEYFSKLEQAEIAVLKASRAEQFAKSQARETEESHAEVMAERQKMDAMIEDLERQNQRLEERLEDMSTDLDGVSQAKRRLQHELEDYRSQRAIDIEDKESSMEQTRKKYQAEFATLTKELDLAREEKLYKQSEIVRLREELDELRSKWDDEVLNSSTWAKEKSRLESTLADVVSSRDEAVSAHNEAQTKVVSLLSQVRTLRSSVDEVTTERDLLIREKRNLEARFEEAKAGLDDLAKGGSPSLRDAASSDRQIVELKSNLAKQEDLAAAAVEKMRRAESLVAEIQRDMGNERETCAALQKDKAALEKNLNEAQLKLVDLETKGYSSASQDIKFLYKRIQELENQLEDQENERNKTQRTTRNVDRIVKDLQGQIDRKDKQNTQLSDDVSRMRDRVDKLLRTIDELQSSESTNQLTARRAERELREEKEKSLRLERELEGWKSLRDKATGSPRGPDLVDVPRRKSSISRVPSLTKGFL
ncbi:homoserine O-acetyltransferase/O-succinyltransferase [Geosmithia morbida]|uniref:Homoserine O-acetyltransferase/O-succinyltransferase n=1 Tax=Geosmithia morbida TaxID=1094350 RepID=A0A9P4YZB0_9HYPO|nr:homoserine O-acetyltransferase/O-succinyltransferase [Geosmithia morbida]KAF4124511.1 homoserine O-acetyltransferase/O-succinyltransferase [Geosmithia morbida]